MRRSIRIVSGGVPQKVKNHKFWKFTANINYKLEKVMKSRAAGCELLKTISALLMVVSTVFSFAGEVAQDDRFASSICTSNKEFVLSCDYRYSAQLDVKEVQLEIDGKQVQIKADEHRPFPATKEQTTSVLILADVSDPKRKNTVEIKYAKTIGEILATIKPHQKVGLAVFDSDIRVVAPLGSDQKSLDNASKSLKATGQATEFYKNILAAIELLKKSKGDRKGLVIMSDGRDEDRAYKLEDVVKLAKENNITILSLGYLETQQDTPFLQSLKRVAEDTKGQFFDVTNGGALPTALLGKPFAFIERGGRVSYQLPKEYGTHQVKLSLGRANGEKINLQSEVTPPDERETFQKIIDYVIINWIWVSVFTVLGLLLIAISIYLIVKRIRKSRPVVYGALIEMNGMGTRHTILQTAIRVGRGSDNDIRLLNDSISMHHAEIHRRREGDFYIVDLASTNGVYVNETKTHQGELKHNDIVELGEVRLRFEITV